jgi:hypothetical protein
MTPAEQAKWLDDIYDFAEKLREGSTLGGAAKESRCVCTFPDGTTKPPSG